MQKNPIPALIREYRKTHRLSQAEVGARIGLSGSRIHQLETSKHTSMRKDNLDNLLLLISKKPKPKGIPMGFQKYEPVKGWQDTLTGEKVRISPNGTFTISADTVKAMGIQRGMRRRLYWAPESKQIGIEFVKGPESGSGALAFKNGGAVNFFCPNFFKKFKIRLPTGKAVDLVPTVEAGKPNWVILNYTDIP